MQERSRPQRLFKKSSMSELESIVKPQRPSEVKKMGFTRYRTYSSNEVQFELRQSDIVPELARSRSQFSTFNNSPVNETTTSPIKRHNIKFHSSIQELPKARLRNTKYSLNNLDSVQSSSLLHVPDRSMPKQSLNELDLELELQGEDDPEKARKPKSRSIQDFPSLSNINLKLKPSIGVFPKSVSPSFGESKYPSFKEDDGYSNFLQVKHCNLYWYPSKTKDQDMRPKGRERASLTVIGNKAYLYGGYSTGIMRDLFVYNLKKNKWKIPAVTGDVPRQGRAGHSALAINSSLWIFGGETEIASNTKNRMCLNSIVVYNTKVSQWRSVQARCLKEPIQPRRNHAACVYDQIMVVYGGIGQLGEYLNDVWVFNTESKVWKEIEIKESSIDEKGIAHHTMCSVFQGKEVLMKEKQLRKVAMEGFYVFGGRNQKGEILDRLKLLRYDQGGMAWTYPTTKGVRPEARYGHSMIYAPEAGCLMIYGGRNDKLFQEKGSFCLGDVKVLNLANLCWCSVSTFGDLNDTFRYAHSADLYGSQMVIFGGLHDSHFLDTELKRLEFNQAEVKVLQASNIKHNGSKKVSFGTQFEVLLESVVSENEFDSPANRTKNEAAKPKASTVNNLSLQVKATKTYNQ